MYLWPNNLELTNEKFWTSLLKIFNWLTIANEDCDYQREKVEHIDTVYIRISQSWSAW